MRWALPVSLLTFRLACAIWVEGSQLTDQGVTVKSRRLANAMSLDRETTIVKLSPIGRSANWS